MVTLSKKVNKHGIQNGWIEIVQGEVNKLPFSKGFFDLVTAFDTINFWDDIDCSLNEIKRVLKQGGVFVIVNGYPKAGTKWYDFLKFKNDEEYKTFLTQCGFRDIVIKIENQTIIIQAKK
jgi:ubiquinone/menaquinone biosynthesis C-methylase UbiE